MEEATSTSSSRRIDEIGKKAQDLIERINESRAMDQKLTNSFEEKLMKKVESKFVKKTHWINIYMSLMLSKKSMLAPVKRYLL